MDPNTNPTANPNPGAAPATPATPAAPAANPAAAAAPAVPGAAAVPATTPASPAATPATPATAAGGITTPQVNPIINPTGNPAAQTEGLAATDPIMRPEPAPAPDPVEEELKAPMVAAAPVPGSIGSAVSGPAAETTEASVDAAAAPAAESAPATGTPNPFVPENKQTPNVAFNDPATQPDPAAGAAAAGKNGKKKPNKTTLIALIAVAAVIVIALIVVLVIMLNTPATTTANNTPNNPVVIEEEEEEEEAPTVIPTAGALSCTRNMTAAEIARFNDAVSGTINVSATFDEENTLATISLIESVVYNDENATNNEPVEETVHEATVDDINAKSAEIYYLPVDKEDGVDLSRAGIYANYESLDFTCDVL